MPSWRGQAQLQFPPLQDTLCVCFGCTELLIKMAEAFLARNS